MVWRALCLCLLALAAASPARAGDSFVIGVMNDESGPYADLAGPGSVEMARMAVEDFGGKVLGKPIELVVADHQNKVDVGLQIARQWYDERGATAIFDITNSGVALAIQDLAKSRNRLVIFDSASSSDLTGNACSPNGIQWNADNWSNGVALMRLLIREKLSSFFFITADYAFGASLEADARDAIAKAGGTVVGGVRSPLNTADFSSYLVEAQGSGARVVVFAITGADLSNALKQANEFKLAPAQYLATPITYLSDVNALGLDVAHDLTFMQSWYWDLNDRTRDFAKRFFARRQRMPNDNQVALYSSVRHYLEAVAKAGTDEAGAVTAAMREAPIHDIFTDAGSIRPDGRVLYDRYLMRVKSPAESKYPWDYLTVVARIPAAEAFAGRGRLQAWDAIAEPARSHPTPSREPSMSAIPMTAGAKAGGAGVSRIVLASLVGTTIEFYDFYIFGTAAALVFGPMFFPKSAPETQTLNAYLTFGIAFLARPVGSFLFGHFGDRIGRKSTLVATMLTMGAATTLIGALPSYATAGALAPWLLAALRFLQGVGLGGEWGGAALIAVENAPERRRAWFGMFPQLGPPIGFLIATGLFLVLLLGFGEAAFVDWAWRAPFLASAILVAIGLYVRVTLEETPAFQALAARDGHAAVPLGVVVRDHWRSLIQGSLSIVVCYALFYIATVYALGYGVRALGIPRTSFLEMLCVAIVFMGLATPVSAWLADRFGRRPVLLTSAVLAAVVGLAMPALFAQGPAGVLVFLSAALGVMGLTFAPLGALLPELFPTEVRYTGAASAYNLGGILGASFAPSLAQVLESIGGIAAVGAYIAGAAVISFLAIFSMRETRHEAGL